jgi:hypothetical protein
MHRLAAMSFLEPAAHSRVSIGDVRFGSKADIREPVIHVRFTPESGHRASRAMREVSILATVPCCLT